MVSVSPRVNKILGWVCVSVGCVFGGIMVHHTWYRQPTLTVSVLYWLFLLLGLSRITIGYLQQMLKKADEAIEDFKKGHDEAMAICDKFKELNDTLLKGDQLFVEVEIFKKPTQSRNDLN